MCASIDRRDEAEKIEVQLPSVALLRIIEEVRLAREKDIEEVTGVQRYNRVYHRHNR